MSYVAGITSRVKIGAAILIVPYRHPLVLAKMIATADQLSGGRVILGAGLGWLESESNLMGVPHRKRARIADEALAAMRACWESEKPEFQGEVYDFSGIPFRAAATCRPAPAGADRRRFEGGAAQGGALWGWLDRRRADFRRARLRAGAADQELEAEGRALGEIEVAMRTGSAGGRRPGGDHRIAVGDRMEDRRFRQRRPHPIPRSSRRDRGGLQACGRDGRRPPGVRVSCVSRRGVHGPVRSAGRHSWRRMSNVSPSPLQP